MTSYSLVDEQWIPVLDQTGRRRDVGLLDLFRDAGALRMIACDLPTQTFAILRLALAILHRATGGPAGEAAWKALWRSKTLPIDDIAEYLQEVGDRFDLFHPTTPFYQVADLRAGKENSYGLERIIADVPNGIPFMTTRADRGMKKISPAEAAIWLVHCQAYDPSGIKSGAVGDPRVTGGKGYPIGAGTAGWLGGVYLEGDTLLETLMLNLVPVEPNWLVEDDRDLPVWERDAHTSAEEPAASRGPFGVLSLYTWQSRRIRLFGDRGGVTGAMISNGDPLEWQDRHLLEPMSVFGRSANREKALKKAVVYLPRPHDHARSLWRGLQVLLPEAPTPKSESAQQLSPMVVRWLAHLIVIRFLEPDFRARPRAASITYGSKQAVIDEVYGDSLTMNAVLFAGDSPLRTAAVDSAGDAEKAVKALRDLARNLVRAAGGPDDAGEAERASERAYARLDTEFRRWLSELDERSDPLTERRAWQKTVRRNVFRLGQELVDAAGPTAWAGRMVRERNGVERHYSSPQAAAWFSRSLAEALSLNAGTENAGTATTKETAA